jgi:sucrose phosphorylase
MSDTATRMQAHLHRLYGPDRGPATYAQLRALLDRWATRLSTRPRTDLSERDAILITYADQIHEPGQPPLRSLGEFCDQSLRGLVNAIHLLPFFPYSSDDGFSVTDYRAVNPAWGDWDDVARIGRGFRLMFDAVLNHVSAKSAWFGRFVDGDAAAQEDFIVPAEGADLSRVDRPRALPLLTRFETALGPRQVWTTFSPDQVDLNYASPTVVLEMMDVLLGYVAHGAEFLRLDAIAYLWKQPGTSCIHLAEAHCLVQLIRAVLDEVAPQVRLVTETNVPHPENVSYFGDGVHEAQMVYNFALPPLVLDAFLRGSADVLRPWAASLETPSDQTTFFNFLASHDGIGLNPARGLLSPEAIDGLVAHSLTMGGAISERQNADGSTSPYELNINYFDALRMRTDGQAEDQQVERFLTAHAILFALAGVPGIYFHSLFGSRGWPDGVRQTERKRSINREKLARATLERELARAGSLRAQIFWRMARLLRARAASPAFSPTALQEVLDCGDSVLGLVRIAGDGQPRVLCLHNLTPQPRRVRVDLAPILAGAGHAVDLVNEEQIALDAGATVELAGYQTRWLTRGHG